MSGSLSAAEMPGAVVDDAGTVCVITRENNRVPLGHLSEDGTAVVFTKFEAVDDWDGTVEISEINRIEWFEEENHAEVHAESNTFVCFMADDPHAEPVASSPPFDLAVIKGALQVEHVMKLPEMWSYPIGNMVCRNILSGRGYANPSVIYGEYPDFESLGSPIMRKLKDEDDYLKAHPESRGKLPMSLMIPVDDDALSIFEVAFRNRVSEHTGKIVSRDTTLKFIKACLACRYRNPFLERIPVWDGQRRISTFAHDVGLTVLERSEKDARFYIVSHFNTFLFQMARRAISEDNEGRKVSLCPMIVGEQGVGKSSLCMCLALSDVSDSVDGDSVDSGFHASTTVSITDPKQFLESAGDNCIILELDEAESIRKSSTGEVKSFINKTKDTFRNSYGHETEDHVRFHSLIITTNRADVLKDETGNRRFVPVWMVPSDDTKFHMDRGEFPSVEYMGQLWAELAWCVREGVRTDLDVKEALDWDFPVEWRDGADGKKEMVVSLSYVPPKSSWMLADDIRESVTDTDPFAESLGSMLDGLHSEVGTLVTTQQMFNEYRVYDESAKYDFRTFAKLVAEHIGSSWIKPGKSGKKRVNGVLMAGYVRVKAPNGDTSLDAFEDSSE